VITEGSDSSFATQPAGVILALQRATHDTLRLLTARLAGENLSGSEINVLANLADGRVRSVGELAVDTGTKPTTLTSLLDRLASRGLLTRELDPADRRSFLLTLTAPGSRAARAARDVMDAIEAEALGSVSDAELAGFHAVVRALTAASQ